MIKRVNILYGEKAEQVHSEINRLRAGLETWKPLKIIVNEATRKNHMGFLKDLLNDPRLEAKTSVTMNPKFPFGVIRLEFGNSGILPLEFKVLNKVPDIRIASFEREIMLNKPNVVYLIMSNSTVNMIHDMDLYLYDMRKMIHTYCGIPIALTEAMVPGEIDIITKEG